MPWALTTLGGRMCDRAAPGMTHDPVSYGALDVDDFEFEQMFTDAMGIDDFGG
uniref:UL48_1 n=1 Tax=Human herpesvirus 2 TaxID=10310 RepID=A0A481TVP7_HHV2|nr:UL48_1 [Human alphaherpesvirus 2]